MKQFHHARRSLKRRAVDAAFDCEANALVKGLKGAHQTLDAMRFFHRTEAHVHFHLRLCRDDIAARPPANYADIKARAAGRVVHRMRSEERRVGKECRFRWSPYNEKKKK